MTLKVSKKGKSISKSHSYSPRQEAKFAKEYGGKLVRNSGRGINKGDSTLTLPAKIAGESDSFLGENLELMIDNKATIHESYRVTTKVLTKLIEQALSENKFPVLHVELNCDMLGSQDFFILPAITFGMIKDFLSDKTFKVINTNKKSYLLKVDTQLLHVKINCDTVGSEQFFVLQKDAFDELMERWK